jgi:transposase-like protein
MSDNQVVSVPRLRIPRTEKEHEASRLIYEVRDLFVQFKREVPKARGPWPESIKERIMLLWGMGVSSAQIGSDANIPVQTLYSWRQRLKRESTSEFAQIPVIRHRRRTAFQIREDNERRKFDLQPSRLESKFTKEAKAMTVIVITPNGLRIEIPIDEAVKIVRELSE